MATILKVENLSKKYRLGLIGMSSLRDDVQRLSQRVLKPDSHQDQSKNLTQNGSKPQEFWALKDVSFSLSEGEILGIVGHNGAGKSTLLKLLSRITTPTEGSIKIKGRVGSLLEVGTGFHPELTGRENIYLNGSILGMTRAEISTKLDEIIDFSDMQRFIDTPVKRYSSGMVVRLAFSVAAHLEPEILIFDEVLAVGDAAFQAKCLSKMKDVAEQGRTVLFVSHNLASIRNLCSRAICLDHGRLVEQGDTSSVVAHYEKQAAQVSSEFSVDTSEQDQQASYIESVKISPLKTKHGASKVLQPGKPLSVGVTICLAESVDKYSVSIGIYDQNQNRLALLDTESKGIELTRVQRKINIRCEIPTLPLLAGDYFINVGLTSGGHLLDVQQRACRFYVTHNPDDMSLSPKYGPVHFEQHWIVIDDGD